MSGITKIIFVRHAQSLYGEDDRIRPLTESGLKNREIVLETLKDIHIDAFLSSPYKRSIDTIRTAADFWTEWLKKPNHTVLFITEILCNTNFKGS